MREAKLCQIGFFAMFGQTHNDEMLCFALFWSSCLLAQRPNSWFAVLWRSSFSTWSRRHCVCTNLMKSKNCGNANASTCCRWKTKGTVWSERTFPVWTQSAKSAQEENLEIRRRLGKHALRVLYISQQTSWQNSATKERNHIILRIWCSCHVYCSLGILKIYLQYDEDLKRYICIMLTNSSQCVCSSKLFN